VGATHKDDRRDRGGHRAMILDASVGRSGVRIGSSPRFQFILREAEDVVVFGGSSTCTK
jgi:hypothetical protein